MSPKKETFLILDGNALLHRAWHALPPLTTKDGKVVNAAYGFAMVLEKMLADFHPKYMAVAWDLPGKTFRHEQYEPYKAQREEKAQELYDQIPIIQNLLKLYGVPSISAEGFEADDVIATLAKQAEKKNMETLIVTGDLDSLQLVDDKTYVVFFQKGISETKTYDPAAVQQRYGLTPEQLVDYKALRGDPSDNLPGVSGIGEKTATELLQKFKTVDGIFRALRKGEIPEKYAKKLFGHEKTAEQMRGLVELVRNAPVSFHFHDSEVKTPDRDALLSLYRDLEFRTLLRKYASQEPAPPMAGVSEKKSKKISKFTLIRSLSELDDTLPKFSKLTVGVLVVRRPDNLFGLSLAGLAVSDGKTTLVVPDPSQDLLDRVGSFLKDAEQVVTHDAKTHMHLTRWHPDNRWVDLMVASYLLHSGSRSHDIPSIANDQLKEKLPEMPTVYATDSEFVALAEAVRLFPAISEKILKAMEKQNVRKVFDEIETPLIPVLFEMEEAGIELDVKVLEQFSKKLEGQLEALTKKITKLAGEEFNVNSPSQLAVILFEKLALPTKGVKKTSGGFSTAASELEKLMDEHEIIPLIAEYRELAKLQSTYVETLPALVGKDGRVHTTFNQTVAATGRLSSSDPNLQNIPIRSELGNEVRKAFVAGKGNRLVSVDYSQLELRIGAVIAKDEAFIRAFREGADIHTRTAAEVWGVPEVDVAPDQRRAAKAINFGIMYGMGPRALARSTGMKFEEAKDFIERYFAVHPAIREYMDAMKLRAHAQGYVETPFGRRRYLPEIQSGVPQLVAAAERMAINMPIQGAEADIMKKAMIVLDGWLKRSRWPAKMLLQVHDELVLEVAEDAIARVAKGLKEIMECIVNWEVPLVVEVEAGKNWGEMEAVC